MTTPQAPTPTILWLTSRSTIETGTQRCAFKRYIENHAGPYGYGFQRKAQSLPLVTGSYTHVGCTSILQWVMDARKSSGSQPDAVPDEVIRWAVEVATEKYEKVCITRGILALVQDDEDAAAALRRLITEQKFLIEGLIWQWSLQRLQPYLNEYIVIAVEEEESYVLDCSCGLGSGLGEIADHEARGCTGIGLQSKPDVLGERRSDSKVAYTEFKTAGQARKAWNDSWERKQQFLMGILGAERRHGVEITHAWVEGLIKGKRGRPYPYTDDLPKSQDTPLCYAYFSPGAAPSNGPEWRPRYKYRDKEGLEFTAGKKEGFKSTALWEVPREEAFPGIPEEMSVGEYWNKTLLYEYPYHAEKCLSLIGPLPKQRQQIDKALRSVVAEERLWQDRLWKIYEFSQANGVEWGNDQFMEFVETQIPRSWACDPYGPDHPCPCIPICHPMTEDWRDPVASGMFVYRVPHHIPEKQQAISRGLQPVEGWGEEEDEDDGD